MARHLPVSAHKCMAPQLAFFASAGVLARSSCLPGKHSASCVSPGFPGGLFQMFSEEKDGGRYVGGVEWEGASEWDIK